MYRKLMDVLMALAKEMVKNDMKIEDAIVKIDDSRIDLYHINKELKMIEEMNILMEEELDALKNLLVYVLIKNTEFDPDDIYALVFGSGRTIIWS